MKFKLEVLILQGQGPFNVDWTRKDGRPLPSRAEILENYDLIIRNAQPSDSGIYVITVISSFGTSTDEVEVEREDALDVFRLADEYLEEDLKKELEKLLFDIVDVDNVLKMFLTAKQMGNEVRYRKDSASDMWVKVGFLF